MGTPVLRSVRLVIAATCLLGASYARGAQMLFNINATGAKEVTAGGVPNQGDPDGTITGTILLDNGTGSGTTGSATFNLTIANIDTTSLSGHHIHQAAATTTGGIVLDFGDPDTIRSGNSIAGVVNGLSAPQISTIIGNQFNFYYNIHNTPFPSGAVRSQLPEPTTFAWLALGAGCLIARRRRVATTG